MFELVAGMVFQCTLSGYWPQVQRIACDERVPDIVLENAALALNGERCGRRDFSCRRAAAYRFGESLAELVGTSSGMASHGVTLFEGPVMTCTAYSDAPRDRGEIFYARCEAEGIGDIGCAMIQRGVALERRGGQSGCSTEED